MATTDIQVRLTATPRTPYRCPVCGGRGTVPTDFYAGLGASTSTLPQRCRSCVGTGIVWSTEPTVEWAS